MEFQSGHYQAIGFFSSGTIGMMHFGDILMALVLGFVGSFGAWLFKKLVNRK